MCCLAIRTIDASVFLVRTDREAGEGELCRIGSVQRWSNYLEDEPPKQIYGEGGQETI